MKRVQPSRAYTAKMRTFLEPSLHGKMILALRQVRPPRGYNVCKVETFTLPESQLEVLQHFTYKREALAFQQALRCNSVIVGRR